MKKYIYISIGYILFMMAWIPSQAQPHPTPKEKVKQWKIAYLTDRLQLSPEEAKVFWPVYDKYEDEQEALKKKYKNVLPDNPTEMATLSDAEVEKRIEMYMEYKQALVNLQKKYNEELRKVISARKLLLLLDAQEEFKKEMMKKVKGPGPHPQRPPR